MTHVQAHLFHLSRSELLVECETCDNTASEYMRNFQKNFDSEYHEAEAGGGGGGGDMGFYTHNYGMATVEKRNDIEEVTRMASSSSSSSSHKATTLVYYRIWKNANDNIRRIMFHYSSLNDFNVEGFSRFD